MKTTTTQTPLPTYTKCLVCHRPVKLLPRSATYYHHDSPKDQADHCPQVARAAD